MSLLMRQHKTLLLIITLTFNGALHLAVNEVHAQELPVVGTRLWKVEYRNGSPTGAIAYAPNANIVFGGSHGGKIYVINGTTGVIQDTIWTNTWLLRPDGVELGIVSDISCSYDGSVIAVTARNLDSCKVVLLEYPSKRILMDSLYVGGDQDWWSFRVKVSPSGRYVVVPDTGNFYQRGLRLHDRLKDTVYILENGRPSQPDFDDAERFMVYNTHGVIDGPLEYDDRVSVLDLNETPPTPRHLKEYGLPSISADGRILMISGLGVEYKQQNPDLVAIGEPRSSVYDLQTDSLIWRITGDLSGDFDHDLTLHQWSKDATSLFVIRDSKNIPTGMTGRILYRVGDSTPVAKLCDECWFAGRYWSEYTGSIANSNLTVAYYNGQTGLLAVAMTGVSSNVDEKIDNSGIVYPNPSTGELRVRCSSIELPTRWLLTTNNGVLAAQGSLVPDEAMSADGTTSIQLDKELSRGSYLLTLRNDRGVLGCTQKVVLQ